MYRSTKPINRHYQAGIGSLELALISPILLLFIVLIFQSLKASYIMEKRLIASRNAAWESELYHGGGGSLANVGQVAEVLTGQLLFNKLDEMGEVVNIHDENVFSFYKTESSESFTTEFLTTTRRGLTQAPLKSWSSNLDANKFTVSSGTALSRSIPILEAGQTVSSNKHFADFARGWENTDKSMTSGYDSKLKPKLDPEKLYPDAIP